MTYKNIHKRPIPFARKLRILFLRWHRAVGIFSALFVLLLSLSGFILNHAHDWGIDQKGIAFKPLLHWYGIETKTASTGFKFGNSWLTNQQQSLYWDQQEIASCLQLNTVLPYQNYLLAFCSDQIIVLTTAGLIVEKLSEFPEPIKQMSLSADGSLVFVHGESHLYQLDLESLNFLPANGASGELFFNHPVALPSSLQSDFEGVLIDHSVTWERVLLDLHSGRFFGRLGVLFVDLLALMFFILSITGAWLWLRRH